MPPPTKFPNLWELNEKQKNFKIETLQFSFYRIDLYLQEIFWFVNVYKGGEQYEEFCLQAIMAYLRNELYDGCF
jgi:hypothetical protein